MSSLSARILLLDDEEDEEDEADEEDEQTDEDEADDEEAGEEEEDALTNSSLSLPSCSTFITLLLDELHNKQKADVKA